MSLLLLESKKVDGNLSLRLESAELVLPRRDSFLEKNGIDPKACVFIETEHEDKITHVGVNERGQSIVIEALISNTRGVFLCLLTADCFPVSFYDSRKGVIALAHLGWKPTGKKLFAKVVKEMCGVYGSVPDDIEVYIGPGIHKESYVFKDPVQKSFSEWSEFMEETANGETSVDIIAYILKQASESQIQSGQIRINPNDTGKSEDYFSHYRSVRAGEVEGRFMTVLSIV